MDTNKSVWESKKYYKKSKNSSSDESYEGMQLLKKYSNGKKNILDLGCGEGTRLSFLKKKDNECVGVDVSKTAISLARKNYPKCTFVRSNLEKLSFNDNSFDFVYSAFVLEHLDNPKIVLKEADRMLGKDGVMVIMAPNFGAPNRISPPAKYSRSEKIIKGLKKDFIRLFKRQPEFKWIKVKPLYMNNINKYQIDFDTKSEPYISDLVDFFINRSYKILYKSTLWDQDSPKKNISCFIKILGKLKIYPFINWGPHILLVVKKLV